MNNLDRLKQTLDNKNRNAQTVCIVWGKVSAVNWHEKTAEVEGLQDDLPYHDVSLGIGSVFVKPKINSACILGILENDPTQTFLLDCQETELVQIFNENLTVEISSGKVKIQNGETNFKQCLNDILTQLKNAIILTPNGPGKFSDADKTSFDNFKNKINQIFY